MRSLLLTLGFNAPLSCHTSCVLRVVAEITPEELPGYTQWSQWFPAGSNVLKFASGAPLFSVCKQALGCETNSRFLNNVMRYTDSGAIYLNRGGEDVIENNLFEHIDYAAVGKCALPANLAHLGKHRCRLYRNARTLIASQCVHVR